MTRYAPKLTDRFPAAMQQLQQDVAKLKTRTAGIDSGFPLMMLPGQIDPNWNGTGEPEVFVNGAATASGPFPLLAWYKPKAGDSVLLLPVGAQQSYVVAGSYTGTITPGGPATTVTYSQTAPPNPATGDVWYETNASNQVIQVNVWSGTQWIIYETTAQVLASGTITTAQLAAGAVTAPQMAAAAVTAGTVAAGAIDRMTINAPTISGGTISAADFVLEPGSNNAILAYGTPPPTTLSVSATGSGTWTCPAGVTSIQVECWGAGGGGGGGTAYSSTSYSGSGGGGGGEYAAEPALAVTPGKTYAYSVGVGGRGGQGLEPPTSAANGAAGTATTFTGDSVTVMASPGGGGLNYPLSGGSGGAGGTGSTNSVHYDGGAGGSNAANAYPNGGGGGGSGGPASAGNAGSAPGPIYGGSGAAAVGYGGNGGRGDDHAAGAGAGGLPGGGGGGGEGYAPSSIIDGGANGANGQIRITYQVASGTPQLLASAAAIAGTDKYGTVVQDGFCAYDGTARMQLHVNASNACPAIEMYTGLASEQTHPSLYTQPVNPGATNEREQVVLAGPASTYDSLQPSIFLQSNAKDGSTGAFVILQVGSSYQAYVDHAGLHVNSALYGGSGQLVAGDPLVSFQPGTTTPETWHNLTLPSGATGYFRYRLLTSKSVMVQAELSWGSNVAANVQIGQLPAGYIPTTHFKESVGAYQNGPASGSGYQTLRFQVDTSGGIWVLGSGATFNEIDFCKTVPLD